MKRKALSLALAFAMAAGLCIGCTSTAPAESSTQQSEVASTGETVETTEVGDEVLIKEFKDMTAAEIVADIRTGWSLGNTLDSATSSSGVKLAKTAEMSWGNPITTKEMITAVKDAGFNAVRIPVTWEAFTSANYAVNLAWLNRVQEVVDYAIDNDMYVILNAHHESWITLKKANLSEERKHLMGLWTCIGERFKGYDEHLIFEGMNEPRCIGTSIEWTGGDDESRSCINTLNAAFVEAVRATGANNEKRLLMIPDYAASSAEVAMSALELPDDDMLCVSLHAYIPYSFALAIKGTSTWSEDKDTGEIDNFLANIDKYFLSKDIPVIIGEYGCMNKENEADRAACVEYYVSHAAEKGIPMFWWDNNAFTGDGENFGLLDRRTLEWQYKDVLQAIMDGSASRVK